MTGNGSEQRPMGSFATLRGKHLAHRISSFGQWRTPYARDRRWGYHQQMLTSPSAQPARVRDEYAHESEGVNLLSQDYLGLSTHPEVRNAILEALDTYGPHSAGSPAAAGDTSLAADLCTELSHLVGMEHIVLFPTGWAAGFGAVNALVRRFDHIVIDELAHACVHEGSAASRTPSVIRTPHLDNQAVHEALRRIRAHDTANGIMVITESLFSMNSDTPDLAELQDICRRYDALLLVDQAHDIGVMGPAGQGQAAAQGMRGELDLTVGSFSKAFATNGGYLATNSESVAQYVRYFASTHIFSSALTPLQAAGALAAARIMRTDEGQARRDAVLRNARVLREELIGLKGCAVLGEASPIVPLVVPSLEAGRTALRIAEPAGVLAHLVEFPVVPRGQARFRLQLSSAHSLHHLRQAGAVLSDAVATAYSPHDARARATR